MASDAGVIVTGVDSHDLLEREYFFDPRLMEADGVDLQLSGELRNVEHFFLCPADVAADEIAVEEEIILGQDGEGIADLLLRDAFLQLRGDPFPGDSGWK